MAAQVSDTIYAECLSRWDEYRGNLSFPAFMMMMTFFEQQQPKDPEYAGFRLVLKGEGIEVRQVGDDHAELTSIQSERDFYQNMLQNVDSITEAEFTNWQVQRMAEITEQIEARTRMLEVVGPLQEFLTANPPPADSGSDLHVAHEACVEMLIGAGERLTNLVRLRQEQERIFAMTPVSFLEEKIASLEKEVEQIKQRALARKEMEDRVAAYMAALEEYMLAMPEADLSEIE